MSDVLALDLAAQTVVRALDCLELGNTTSAIHTLESLRDSLKRAVVRHEMVLGLSAAILGDDDTE